MQQPQRYILENNRILCLCLKKLSNIIELSKHNIKQKSETDTKTISKIIKLCILKDLSRKRNYRTSEHIQKFEKPKEIIDIPKFKETATGKIMRKDSLKSLA
jgi:O-succinylbenzoic acid--CoA ligase